MTPPPLELLAPEEVVEAVVAEVVAEAEVEVAVAEAAVAEGAEAVAGLVTVAAEEVGLAARTIVGEASAGLLVLVEAVIGTGPLDAGAQAASTSTSIAKNRDNFNFDISESFRSDNPL